MTEAKAKRLVTRTVTGPKPIHAYDADGTRHVYNVGDTVQLPPHAAKRFARYLAAPEVAAAQAKVAEAEVKAAAEGEAPPTPVPGKVAVKAGGGASAS